MLTIETIKQRKPLTTLDVRDLDCMGPSIKRRLLKYCSDFRGRKFKHIRVYRIRFILF